MTDKEKLEALKWALLDARGFADWVECLGRLDCEIYRYELKVMADLALERIDKAMGIINND